MFVLLALLANFLFASQSLHAQNTVPGAVGTLSAQAKHERVTLTWVAATVDGGTAITGYSIYERYPHRNSSNEHDHRPNQR